MTPHTQLNLPFIPTQFNDPVFHFLPEQYASPLKPTIKEILKQYLKRSDADNYLKIFQKVLDCGTGKLGFHINVCDHCAETKIIPNPCSSSLCPDCQKENSEHWINKRISELLPVPYYQTVFSLPDSLSVFTMYNKKIVFDIFFTTVAAAMNKIPGEKNIEIGFIVALQTWASCLWFDPHMHICLPGIGILKNGKLNHYPSKESLPFNEDILREEFKKVFLEKLDDHYFKKNIEEDEVINWPDEMKSIGENETSFKKWIKELEQQEWDVKK
ncbi:transposase, partial [Candidatus Magnetomorum sp. HK-1]